MTQQEYLAAIKQADHEYYDLDNPSMSDAEYDSLRREYIDKYGAEDLNYVPGNASEGFEKFRHPTPVTSLGKWTKGADDEADLLKKIEELWPVEIQPKYDGLTVVAYPNPDGSCKFVTRGLGGEVGEVLPNFIPKYEIEGVNRSGYPMRGEVFITARNFEILNDNLDFRGEEPMKNMRNAAAGLLRRKDRSSFLDLLSYVVYDIPGLDAKPDAMRKIVESKTDFQFTEGRSCIDAKETVDDTMRYMDEIKAEGNIPIDGMVIKSCQENSLAKFGLTGHHPKNALAVKGVSTKHITIVRDVIWQMGRSKATPVAIVDPVEIDGTTVTKASLHNAAQIKVLGLEIGAKVEIHKANEIIPQITKVIEPGDKDIVLDVCPACGGPLQEINGQQFCVNPNCYERVAQNIAFLGNKDVLDIPGLSIQTARKIVDTFDLDVYGGSPQNVVFDLTVNDIMRLPGFAEKSAVKLFNAIANSMKDVELPRFIKALCIPGIGNDIGKILADTYGSLFMLKNVICPECTILDKAGAIELLKEIDGIGPVVAEKLVSNEFWTAVDELSKYIVPLDYSKEEKTVTGDYAGKTFVLTGKMAHPRSYYEDLIVKAGGKVGSACNSKTDYLIIADVNSTSVKAKKARELGVELISPEQAEEMLG